MLKIDPEVFWYKFPAAFNDTLTGRHRPKTICSLFWSLLFGWVYGILGLAILAFLAVVPIPYFFYWLFGGIGSLGPNDGEKGLLVLIGFAEIASLVFYGVVYLAVPWIKERLKKNAPDRASVEKPPGVVSVWMKSIKEKTCFMIDYKDEDDQFRY